MGPLVHSFRSDAGKNIFEVGNGPKIWTCDDIIMMIKESSVKIVPGTYSALYVLFHFILIVPLFSL